MKLKLCTALLTAATLFTSISLAAQLSPGAAAQKSAALESYGKLPLTFEPTVDAARFVAHSGGYSVAVQAREAMVVVNDAKSGKSKALRFGFAHATSAGSLEPLEPQAGVTNYYLGSDPANWRVGVRNFAKVRAQGVYPGIDVVYYGDHRRLEFDFNVAPKADPNVIALSFSGMDKLYKNEAGEIVANLNGQAVRFAKPFAYQRVAGATKSVPVDYELASADSVHLRLGKYDRDAELIIDPVVSFVTYLGGSATDQVNGIAVDSTGNVYVTGTTSSTDFPDGATLIGTSDAFVTKYNATGTAYVYNTIIGGTAPTGATASGNAIALDGSNQAYITGMTNFTNLPGNVNYANGLNTYQGGDSDAYVVILKADGTLLRSTYLGGSGPDAGYGIAVDSKSTIAATYPNAVIVVGQTKTAGVVVPFPGYNAFETPIEEYVSFVTKLDNNLHICKETIGGASVMTPVPTGATPCFFSLTFAGQPVAPSPTAQYSINTYYPLYAIIEDTETPPKIQVAVVAGTSGPTPIGTGTNLWNSAINGLTMDGTVEWLNAGPALVSPPYATSQANAVALDPHGDVFIAGGTNTGNLGATINSFGPFSHYAGTGAWVLKVGGIDGAHLYGAALENTPSDVSATINAAHGIAVDASGRAYIVGTASGSLTTTAGSYRPGTLGAQDAFLIRMNTSGSGIEYGTYLGGSGNDQGLGVAVDNSGAAYVTGSTQSADFPTINPLDDPNSTPIANSPVLTLSGAQDAFVSKFTADGSALIFSTYLGGSGIDQGNAIAIDTANQGNMYIGGSTYSADLTQLDPSTYTAPQASYGGNGDGFVAMIAGASLPTVTVTPGSLSFGIQDENISSNPVAVQYTDTNAISSVTVSNIVFGGNNPGDFYQVFPAGTPGNCSASGLVAASSACDIWVVFKPTGPGARSATLTISDNTSSTAHVIALSGTGAVPEDSFSATSLTFASQLVNTSSAAQLITLQDTGQGILNISSIAISGTNSGDFSGSDNCTSQIASGSSCTIQVVFTPTALGTRTAVLTVTDNAYGSPHQIALTGTAIAVANTITPTSLTFNPQPVNSTSTALPVVVQNTDASQTLTIAGATITGDFQVSSNGCLVSLAPNASCTIQVVFDPSTTGTRTGTLTISGNGSGMPAAVQLTGTGISGSGTIMLSPTSLTFSSQAQGTTSNPQIVTVSNSSTTTTLTVSSIVLTNAASNTDFKISATTCPSTPFTLAALANCTVSLTFGPTVSGTETGSLTVNGSSSNSPQKVTLTGSGNSVSPAGADFTLTSNSSGVSVVQGGTASFVLSVAPVNGFNSSVGFACSAGFSCSFSPSTLAMDGTTTQTVTLSINTATSTGRASGELHRMGARSVFFALLPFTMMGMLLTSRRRNLGVVFVLLVICLAMAMAGCGAAAGTTSSSSGGLAPGSYPITVTATSTGSTVVTHTLSDSNTPKNGLTLVVVAK